ncbi:MAG: exodeoxyribonuclease VII large subunit [Pseudomonadota bacterium]|nr:exodeoxyribonuclease VII large subunit [Pseudomonadota bacterium]
MTDISTDTDLEHNVVELSVSEISQAVKRTLEGAFDHVRVRGEVGRPNYHSSGHLYFTLKDEGAAMDAVCWRGVVGRLNLRLEEGMEVVCTGRVSSYPKSSRYQIVIEAVELAGAGALLKLLEDRRKKLAGEGLFDPERKRALPFLPDVIGVITSPTGAVIRDILHRLDDRFPRHVLLWPVRVQGDAAESEVVAAIEGFNGIAPGGEIPRPDVLIVARGGGSLEDLMPFNGEAVVRATAASDIPLISAIGHETDTTLIDHSADLRAPTPTAAAEFAVPVRDELLAQVLDDHRRMESAVLRMFTDRATRIEGLGRGLPDPNRLLEVADQNLDGETERLGNALKNLLEARIASVNQFADRLGQGGEMVLRAWGLQFNGLDAAARLERAATRSLTDAQTRLKSASNILDSLSYERVLDRGYALVRDAAGNPLTKAAQAKPGDDIAVRFGDGAIGATVHGAAKRAKPKSTPGDRQGQLL